MHTIDTVTDYLADRAALYGGDVSDMISATPVRLWDSPNELMAFWEDKDLSHIWPQSQFPEMADDWGNIIPEDPTLNRARGAEVMDDIEVEIALLDNEIDADIIDMQFNDDSDAFGDAIELLL